jgi:uncharacterized protein
VLAVTEHSKNTVVIYHGECLDGFCAAWMAWRKFGDEAEYVPASYGQEPPDVEGKRVYIVDFSYPRETLVRMAALASKVVVLDHHLTAQKDLEGLDAADLEIIFDMSRSGAGIARDYFHPGLNSWLVDYTQDRDLWRFALSQSKEVNAFIGTLKQTFEKYEWAHNSLTTEDAARLGEGAHAYKEMYVEKMVKQARRVRFAGYKDIPLVNAPYVGISELVGALAETALFAAGWFQRSDGRIAYSLRSRGEFDVSGVAQRFGGGGHAKAAGFVLDKAESIDALLKGPLPAGEP